MSYLLDTNVVSEVRKGSRADPYVRSWYESLDDGEIHLSVLTIGEIRLGIERLRPRDRPAAAALERWLQSLLHDHGDRILAINSEVAEEWGRLAAPEPLPVIDGLLAATARVHGLTLATRNVRHVIRTGVRVLNPFAPPDAVHES